MTVGGAERPSRFKSIYKQLGRTRSDPTAEQLLASARSTFGIPMGSSIAWMAEGACVARPEIDWFPTYGEPADEAKAVCGGCRVRETCLDQAIKRHEYGVWGGTTERERESLRSPDKRRATARALPEDDPDATGRILPFG
jgi:WhiB family redox-sensing transcriptional regulator